MQNAKGCAQQFAVFLYENNHLQDFSITKGEAKSIFNNSFKKAYKTKINFGTAFYHTIRLLKKPKDFNVMCYKKDLLMKLINNESKIGTSNKQARTAKKNTLISHSFSFRKNDGSKEVMVSPEKCKLCDVQFASEANFKQHCDESKHKFFETLNSVFTRPKKQQKPGLEFKVEGSKSPDNIIVRKDEQSAVRLIVTNASKTIIKIKTIQVKPDVPQIKFEALQCPLELKPSTNVELPLTADSSKDGTIYFPILFTTEKNGTEEQYAADLVFHIHNEFFDDLHPVEAYKKYSAPILKEYIEKVDSGERPNIFPPVTLKVPLKQYLLPLEMAACLNAGLKEFEGMTDAHRSQLASLKNLLSVENKASCLNARNYTKLLDLLLYIEEHQMYKDIRDYDRENQVLTKAENNLLELEIPGLAEHRPSVILADPVLVREQKNSTVLYEGFVHKVKETSVLLKFSKRFMDTVFVKGKKFYVSFSFNRYPLKVEHQAVEFTKIDNISHLFFPVKVSNATLPNTDIKWFNRDIAANPEQQQAVQCILQKTSMPVPYLIFGPPGTGKTMTVVEAVKQIHKLTKEKILICAPSNNAANEVTRRLIDTIPTTDLFRYVAPSFPLGQIPDVIKKYVNYYGEAYYQPTMDELRKYRIVLTTVVSAAKLVSGGCPANHFAYVFIDECGQATETETLIPIAHILSNGVKSGVLTGQIVMAGDPKQLGPIIHSTLAKDYGFGTSMLERFMSTCDVYKRNNTGKYNSNAVTKLLRNYRSHPVIMHMSNTLFYDNELIKAGDHLIYAAVNWEGLPNPEFPMIFHSVVGLDQREKSSPSFFNIQEIEAVVSYLDRLIGCKMAGITIREEHIGVISPYKKQIEKIRQVCTKKKYNKKLLIGTVEQIQGQERLIIIISTVRSKFDMLKFDYKFHLGFLDNPKRFNVAITRAKALLIIVGNPNLLQYDKYWHALITYCKNNNAMLGEKFDFTEENNMQEMLQSMKQLSLNSTIKNPEEGPGFERGNI